MTLFSENLPNPPAIDDFWVFYVMFTEFDIWCWSLLEKVNELIPIMTVEEADHNPFPMFRWPFCDMNHH